MAIEHVLSALKANHDRILSELIEFAAIPSVSTDPAHAAAMSAACAGSVLTLGIAANSISSERMRS